MSELRFLHLPQLRIWEGVVSMDFSHFDDKGNAWMVDVGDKTETNREAVACGSIFMKE